MLIKRIRDLREDNDLLQRDIANFLNITQQQYSLYETGIREIPIDLLIKLSFKYNTSVDYILNLTDEKNYYKRKKDR